MTPQNMILLAFAALGVGAVAYTLTRPKTPEPTTTKALPAATAPLFDFGLRPEEEQAISIALRTEKNPDNLKAFANSLDPMFPIAAGLLRSKTNSSSGSGMTG